ncbi:MAG: ester cyclase [Acidobacteriaceae bacterium]
MDLVDRYLSQLLNAGNLSGAGEILALDFRFYGPSTRSGLDAPGFMRFLAEARAAFSNKRFTELDRIAGPDRVALRFRMTGTHDGSFHGIPPTGSTIDVEGCDVIYIRDEKICEIRAYFDLMPIVQSLLVPLPLKIVGGLLGSFFPR